MLSIPTPLQPMAPIDWNPGKEVPNALFSIVIPTWNNLEYIKLCVRSIRQNSTYPHQVILHINDGSDGTLEWAKAEGLDFTHSATNVGICLALNAARGLVRTKYFVYMNDDMYVCPGWDAALKEEIEAMPTRLFFLSSTMIEPYPTHSLPVIGNTNYGTSVETFEEERLLRTFMDHPKADWSGATRPPNLVPIEVWDLVGGYSLEFSPGRYSDPDFSAKLWQAGVRIFKGVARSRVYHFVSKSLLRIPPSSGRKIFMRKWGFSSSLLDRYFLHLGQPYQGILPEPKTTLKLRLRLLKDAIACRWK